MGSLPANAGTQFVVIDPEQPERVYAADETTLYRSDDAGRTWQPSGEGLPEGEVTALTIDPREPSRLYAAAAGGLYLSEDSGTTWRALPGTDADDGSA